MLPKFVRNKFAGVQQPLGRWILRHVVEFIVLSPAILVTFIWLKVRHKEVLLVGVASSAITAFVMPLEVQLRKHLSNGLSLKRLIVLNLSSDANSQVREMYDRVVNICGAEAKLRRRIVWWASAFGKGRLDKLDILVAHEDKEWHISRPTVSLTDSEIEKGMQFLKTIGITDETKIICYATRSESYYQKLENSGVQLKARNVRNPDEKVYFEVAKVLSERGYFVIRMGKDLDTCVPPEFKKYIYDYASSARSEFLDVFLLYRCLFLINGATGMVSMRAIFDLPTLNTDFYRTMKNWFKNDIALFQRVKLTEKNKLMTVSEMVAMGDSFSDERHQERLGVALVKNTVDEILGGCDEMIARLDGTWVTTEEDEILQKKYWNLITETEHNGGRIGAQFLRDNQDLLR